MSAQKVPCPVCGTNTYKWRTLREVSIRRCPNTKCAYEGVGSWKFTWHVTPVKPPDEAPKPVERADLQVLDTLFKA